MKSSAILKLSELETNTWKFFNDVKWKPRACCCFLFSDLSWRNLHLMQNSWKLKANQVDSFIKRAGCEVLLTLMTKSKSFWSRIRVNSTQSSFKHPRDSQTSERGNGAATEQADSASSIPLHRTRETFWLPYRRGSLLCRWMFPFLFFSFQ